MSKRSDPVPDPDQALKKNTDPDPTKWCRSDPASDPKQCCYPFNKTDEGRLPGGVMGEQGEQGEQGDR